MLEALDFFFFWREQNRLLFAAGVEQNAFRFVWGGGQNCCSLAFVVAGVGRGVQSDRFFFATDECRRIEYHAQSSVEVVLLFVLG